MLKELIILEQRGLYIPLDRALSTHLIAAHQYSGAGVLSNTSIDSDGGVMGRA